MAFIRYARVPFNVDLLASAYQSHIQSGVSEASVRGSLY